MERVDDARVALATAHDASVLGGRYVLGAILGAGATSTVFKAQDTVLGREVAIKLFRTDPTDLTHQARSDAEIHLLAGLSHPGLVTVFDAGTDTRADGHTNAYLVMELVGGPTLKHAISGSAVRPHDVADLGAQLAGALAYIHARGVIHRDIKPANILLIDPSLSHGAQVVAKLSDFGIARLLDGARMTMRGMTVGTANYLSPEQATGADIGPASDIYSLGLVLLESLTGQIAFPGTGIEAAIARLHRPPTIPERLGVGWSSLLNAMTAMEPTQRPDAIQVVEALRKLRAKVDGDSDSALTSLLAAATTDQLGPLPGVRWNDRLQSSPPGGAHRARRPRKALILLTVGLAVVLSAVLLLLLARGGSPSPSPNYPNVPGQLGTDLRILQNSVR